MAYNVATWSPDGKLGAVALKSAGLVAADGTETAVELGKGMYRIVVTTTACEVDSNNELYVSVIEANTRNATSTWYELGVVLLAGALEATGRDTDSSASETYETIIDNPYDYQLRVRHYVNGTVATGCNIAVNAYALLGKE